MEIEKLIEAVKLCGSTPNVDQCKQCAYWAGGDMSKCIPRMTAEAATALEQLAAYEDTGLTPEEVQQMRWIPVEERLPEPNTGDGYWVAKKGPRGNTMMKLAQYSDYGMAMSIDAVTDITWRDWDFTKITNVTHWMPLPKAPKEDSHD